MSKRPDNPPAFPVIHPAGVSHQGMTLRDYFAAKAMQAMITATSADRSYPDLDWKISPASPTTVAEHVSYLSYCMADAMLAAREK